MAIGKYVSRVCTCLHLEGTDLLSSHELYIYANTLDMHTDFAPKLKGRYLTSNVNITTLDENGNVVNFPVGGECLHYLAHIAGRRVLRTSR